MTDNRVITEYNSIKLARNWLLYSGIQEQEGNDEGGFNAWYDMDSERYSYIYSEITGYGISTLLYLGKFFEGPYIDRALMATKWLDLKALHPHGGVRTRLYLSPMEESALYSFESDNLYAFDNGMVLNALASLYKITGENNILKFALKIADFIVEKMTMGKGLLYAYINPAKGEKIDSDWKWSSQSGSYHAKLAIGFTDLYEITGKDRYKAIAIDLCEKAMDFQEASGRFVTSRQDGSTHLHPHSYTAEGLLYTGLNFEREDFLKSSLNAVIWALDNMAEDGTIGKKFVNGAFLEYPRVDVLAQTLRLGAIMAEEGILDEKYLTSLEKLSNKLISFQYKVDDEQKGGFYYGYSLEGKKKNHINSWATMFSLQALMMFEGRYSSKGEKKNRLSCFI